MATSYFPFHVYLEGEKPYNGVFKEHPYYYRFLPVAFLLTFMSGFLNACSIFDVYGYALSHLSGLSSGLSVQIIGKHNNSTAGVFALNILSFGIGSFFSGFILAKNKWTLGVHYAFLFIIHGFLLSITTIFINHAAEYKFYGQFLICGACGILNGLTSTYSSNIVRSTHITGMVNDICMILGYWARTRQGIHAFADFWRLTIFIPIWIAFVTGGMVGIAIYLEIGASSFWIPTTFSYFLGFLLLCLRGFENPKQKHVEEGIIAERRKQLQLSNEDVELDDTELLPVGHRKKTYIPEADKVVIPEHLKQKEIDTEFI